MDTAHVVAFLGVSMALTLMPGPDILFVVAQSVSHGRKAGIATALGLCSGITVHTTAAALGISAILQQSALAFQLIKYAGACYLLYLAWQAAREGQAASAAAAVPHMPLKALYKRGILMNVLNPKVSLFFLAFLPQFVSRGSTHPAVDMAILGGLFMAQAVILFSLVALFADRVGSKFLHHPAVARYVSIGKAALFALIGIRMALPDS